jgi:transposase-like protein
VDYPSSLTEFLERFQSDEDCVQFLAKLRWPDGFSCPRCGPGDAWLTKRYLYVCSACEKQTSVIAGTIFEKSKVPLLTWFRAVWFVTDSKSGISAKELQRSLGLSYKTAWLMLHKLRIAMKRPGRDNSKLSGEIEVDESWLGGPTPGGKRGRGAEGKLIVAIAVERIGFGKNSKRWKLGRCRIEVIERANAETLLGFVERNCEPGSIIYTDGLNAYNGLADREYEHNATAVSQGNDPAHVVLPAVHRVASLLKRWLMGTHHGGWGAQHAEAYIDEFIFRFNRRNSKARGLLFYRLLQNAIAMGKTNREVIILRPKPKGTKRRGPQRQRPYSTSAITNTPKPRSPSAARARGAGVRSP